MNAADASRAGDPQTAGLFLLRSWLIARHAPTRSGRAGGYRPGRQAEGAAPLDGACTGNNALALYPVVVVVDEGRPKCWPLAPHALNAAWRVALLVAPAPVAAVGGGSVWVRPLPAPCGIVTPCCFRHFANAVRLAVVVALADAAEVVDMVVVELLPQAAITTLVASAVRPSITRRARRGGVLPGLISDVLS
jgi:hypothetical protein